MQKWIFSRTRVALLLPFFIYGFSARANLDVYQNFVRSGHWVEAQRVLTKTIEAESASKLMANYQLALGYVLQKQSKHEEAVAQFELALASQNFVLEDIAHILRGKSLRALGKNKEAQQELIKAEQVKEKSSKVFLEAEYELGVMHVDSHQWSSAYKSFSRLERRYRSSELYPDILYHLVDVELHRSRKWKACRWARKLYTRFPSHSVIKDWGIDLQDVKLESVKKKLGCVANPNDIKARLRNLQLQGYAERAREEIQTLRSRSTLIPNPFVDSLLATYYANQGEIDQAFKAISEYDIEKGSDFNLLMLLARIANQAGDLKRAVAAYTKAYKLNPRHRQGRSALFQAAYLSYQAQDYDDSVKRFNEFIKKYPRSGLSRDAQWHLAWIRYLKGDYQQSYQQFFKLSKVVRGHRKRRRVTIEDRSTYWMAMSLKKMGKPMEALPLFEKLAADKGFGFYALAAAARKQELLENPEVKQSLMASRSPALASEALTPLSEAQQDAQPSEENESEDDSFVHSEVAGIEDEGDEEAVEAELPDTSPFQSAKLTKRFHRANELIQLAMDDWAVWELYEIEKRVSKPQHLKTLIQIYESLQAYHRSAHISYVYFSKSRVNLGFEPEGYYYWNTTFPRAYERSVTTFSKSYSVPEEFIWGIMRAESQFRAEVTSPVGAMGLMQLMPFTATQVSRLIDLDHFTVDQLFDPGVNIRLGTRYLRRLMKMFEDSVPLSAASYNAGPHRVRGWIKNFGSSLDLDEFIEHIPYLETRNYVKRVLHNYYVYKRLYAKKPKAPEVLSFLTKPVGNDFDDLNSTVVW